MQKYTYVVFITLNYKDKQNNLEILSLWILPIVTTLVKYKTNASQLTMIFVCRSKCIWQAGTGTPFPIPFPLQWLAHKNGTFTMIKLLKLLIC